MSARRRRKRSDTDVPDKKDVEVSVADYISKSITFHDSEAQRKNTKVASITKKLKSIESRLFHSLLLSSPLTTTNSPWMSSALSSSLSTFSSQTRSMLSSLFINSNSRSNGRSGKRS
nr:1307_t:CDS:2 [Entrophospora candida]